MGRDVSEEQEFRQAYVTGSISLVISNMQIKPQLATYYIPTRLAEIEISGSTSVSENVEQLQLSSNTGEMHKSVKLFISENILAVST